MLIALILLAIATAIAATGLWAFQSYGIYRFTAQVSSPADEGLAGVKVVPIRTADGTDVFAWVAAPAPGRPLLISFFGNFAGIGPSARRMKPFLDDGYGMAMLVYRGASGADGTPTEHSLTADALALYDQIDSVLGQPVPPQRRLLHGFSLGTSIAASLAQQREAAGLVLEAGFDRLCRFQTRRLHGVPMCTLMWAERHDVIDRIAAIRTPLLMVHGALDPAIDPAWAAALFDAAPDPKRLVIHPLGHHADLMDHGLHADVTAFAAEIGAVTQP